MQFSRYVTARVLHSSRKAGLVMVLAVMVSAFCSKTVPSPFLTDDDIIKKVVIDPGHGGYDSGCLGSSISEKEVVLDISLQLGELIRKHFPEVEVIYTRTTDEFIELHRRAEIANEANADLFISVHANASEHSRVYGTETFVMGLHRTKENLDVAKRENAVILMEDNYEEEYGGFDPNSSEAYIIFSMYQSAFLDQSLAFAALVEERFRERMERKSRGVKQAGFWVLYRTTMPSVLIETGFLTNRDEENLLNNDAGQEEVAQVIFEAFQQFKLEIDSAAIRDRRAQEAEMAYDGPVFRVQILATSKTVNLNETRYRDLSHIITEQDDHGMVRYMVGKYVDFNEAVNQQNYLRKNGFRNAFVVAYKNGKRIPLQEAVSGAKNN